MLSRRHVRVSQKLLGVRLAGFDASRCLRRSKDGQALLLETVSKPSCQRPLGPDHGQINPVGSSPVSQRLDIGRCDLDGLAERRHASVGSSRKELGVRGVASKLPEQGVFAPTVSHDQDAHGRILLGRDGTEKGADEMNPSALIRDPPPGLTSLLAQTAHEVGSRRAWRRP